MQLKLTRGHFTPKKNIPEMASASGEMREDNKGIEFIVQGKITCSASMGNTMDRNLSKI